MHKTRNSLLIMLVLVTVALTGLVSSALAVGRIDIDPYAPGVSKPGSSWSNGEPDGSGSGAPLPQTAPPPGKLSSGQVRGETPAAPVSGFAERMLWMSRIWAARILGATR
jgi:hypothetical protein